jgi:hypothetical protein
MHRSAGYTLAAFALAALLGCGGPAPDEQAKNKPKAEPGSQEAEETVFDDMIQTEDRARAVEGVLQASKQQTDAVIDAQVDAPADNSQ